MKIQWNIYVDVTLRQKIEREAKKRGTKPSAFIGHVMQKWFLDQNKPEYSVVKCAVCEAEYSTKFDKCPQCQALELKKKRKKESQNEIANQNQKISDLEDEVRTAEKHLKKVMAWHTEHKASDKEIEEAEKGITYLEINKMHSRKVPIEF